MSAILLVIESGKKKTFAAALDWPGWCRSGKDESQAVETLLAYAPRYARALALAGLDFPTPAHILDFTISERLQGSATTDFGAPGGIAQSEFAPFSDSDLDRSVSILRACWQAFDLAVQLAEGRELRKGPRGGGREVDRMIEHLIEADRGYLSRLGWQFKSRNPNLAALRQAMLDALQAAQRGDLPALSPRGLPLWPPRYFIRRAAWHALDHAWEIEDRLIHD